MNKLRENLPEIESINEQTDTDICWCRGQPITYRRQPKDFRLDELVNKIRPLLVKIHPDIGDQIMHNEL
ncbi:hypothetical protein ACTXT7_004836 [Hymenolepis weldensis]